MSHLPAFACSEVMYLAIMILSLLVPVDPTRLVKWQSVESEVNGKLREYQRIEYHYSAVRVLDSISIYQDGKLSDSYRYMSAGSPMNVGDISGRRIDPDSCIRYEWDYDAKARTRYLQRWTYKTPSVYRFQQFTTTSAGSSYLWLFDSITYDSNGWIRYGYSAQYDSNGAVVQVSIDSIYTSPESNRIEHYTRGYGNRGVNPLKLRLRYEIKNGGRGDEEIYCYDSRSSDSLVLIAKFTDIMWVYGIKDNQDAGLRYSSIGPGRLFLRGNKVLSRATRWLLHPITNEWINQTIMRHEYNAQGLVTLTDMPNLYDEHTYFEDGAPRSDFSSLKEPGEWMLETVVRDEQPDGTTTETQFWSSDRYPTPRPQFRLVNHY